MVQKNSDKKSERLDQMEQENGWWKFLHHKWCFWEHSTALYTVVFSKVQTCGVSRHSLGCNQTSSKDQTGTIQPCIAKTTIYHHQSFFKLRPGLARFCFLPKIGGIFTAECLKFLGWYMVMPQEVQGGHTDIFWHHPFMYIP